MFVKKRTWLLITLLVSIMGFATYRLWFEPIQEHQIASVQIIASDNNTIRLWAGEKSDYWSRWYGELKRMPDLISDNSVGSAEPNHIGNTITAYEALAPWHQIIIKQNKGDVTWTFDVRLDEDQTYWIRWTDPLTQKRELRHWSEFKDHMALVQYLTWEDTQSLYEGSILPEYQVSVKESVTPLIPFDALWEVYDIQLNRQLVKHSRNSEEGVESTDAKESINMVLASYSEGKTASPTRFDMASGDIIQLLGLKPSDVVTVRAIASGKAADGSELKPISEDLAFDPVTGYFNPTDREGITRYQIDIQRTSSVPRIGEGLGTQRFFIDINVLPKPTVVIREIKMTAGGFISIVVTGVTEGKSLQLKQTLAEEIKWHVVGNRHSALIPLDYWVKSGNYPYVLSLTAPSKSEVLKDGTWTIKNREFDVQRLTVDTAVESSTRSDEAYEEYKRLFLPVRVTGIEEQLWEGPFIQPISGRITTQYGTRRSVNGELTSYRHNGIDLAAPTGTKIAASNTGKVAFSKKLILTGNSIIIDHGLGVFTVYLHMDSLKVKEGDSVKKGQVIGTVGSTGFSTGAHLHFTTSYYRTNLDPFILMSWDGQLK